MNAISDKALFNTASALLPPRDAHITIRGLYKSFADQPLYQDLNLDFPKNQVTSIFGPNGCGKSTLMNMIAGLVPVDTGQILFAGKTLKETNIGYVFQNYRDALFPWMSAIDNVKYPMKLRGWSKKAIGERVAQLLHLFDVKFDVSRYSYELSGGQQQTICIMRAMATRPEVLFLDEPFSALDYEMTMQIRERLQAVLVDEPLSVVLVSHDLEEALYLADRILMLSRRPTIIADILPFAAPRPRAADITTSAEFIALKQTALEIFRTQAYA
jgi:NitT/TauT family transport system ATP-binding protein